VARQTRDERRKRRAESGAATGGADRTPPRPPTRPTPEPAPGGAPAPRSGQSAAPAAPAHAPARSGNIFVRFYRFVGESIAELRKVEWPSQKQVIQGTTVVLIACIVVGFYLWGADQVFKRLVEHVLLR
jgi:preprotein translocase subunit SecE